MISVDFEKKESTYLLVHGAWHGGWCWERVARRLRTAGHRVFTPTQTGLGERCHLLSGNITMETFVQDLVNVVEFEDLSDIILVGHSYGGRSVAGLADRMPQRIRRLVFLDAGLPEPGKSYLDALPPDRREVRLKQAGESPGGLSIAPPPDLDFGVVDPADAAWVRRHLTPQPLGSYSTPVPLRNPIGNGLPCTYIRCTDPLFPTTDPSASYAKSRKDWEYMELKTGHDAMVTAPHELSDILLKIN